MMHPAEPDARPQSTLWMLDLGQLLPVGPTLWVPAAFTRVGPEVAQELDSTQSRGSLHLELCHTTSLPEV